MQRRSTPRYIIARERENARLLAIKMRELHDKRIARFESFTSLTTACNDKASLQPFKEIFEMSEALNIDLSSPCPSKVESFETMYAFVAGLARKFKDGTVSVAEFVTESFASVISAVKSFCSTAQKLWTFASTASNMITNTIGYKDLLYVLGFFVIYCLLALTPFESLGRAIFMAGMMFSSNVYISEAAKFITTVSTTWTIAKWLVPTVQINVASVAHVQGFSQHPFMTIAFVIAALMCGCSTFAFQEKAYLILSNALMHTQNWLQLHHACLKTLEMFSKLSSHTLELIFVDLVKEKVYQMISKNFWLYWKHLI